MPRLKSETISSGDQSWLATTHGIRNCRTATIDVALFTAGTHYPNGYLPSGLPVNTASETQVEPWTGATGEKLGFIFADQTVNGAEKINAPIYRHGGVKTARLPVAWVAPTTAADAAGFYFVTEAGA